MDGKNGFRFVISSIVIVFGIVLMYNDVNAYSIPSSEFTAIGYGVFTIGAFSYVLLAHQIWNPLVEENQIIELVKGFTGLGGVLWWMALDNIMPLEFLLATTLATFTIGIVLAILADISDIDPTEIRQVYYGI